MPDVVGSTRRRFIGRFGGRLAVGVVVGLVLAASAACAGDQGPPEAARAAVAGFASSWSAGEPAGKGLDPRTATAAEQTVPAATSRLMIRRTIAKPQGQLTCLEKRDARRVNADGGVCKQQVAVTHEVAGLGDWSYAVTAEVRENAEGRWRVWWTPQTFHPELTAETSLVRNRELPQRASILDGSGGRLTQDGPVVRVGVEPRKVDPDVTYAELGKVLGVDLGDLRKRAEASPPTQFVHALTVRKTSYDDMAAQLEDVPGVVTQDATMSLAPTSSYARGILGVVGAATKEALADADPLAMETDLVGLSGLQRAYEAQLAGKPGGSIELVDTESGEQKAELFRIEPVPGEPLQTTLDPFAQEAAERAVEGQSKPTSVVAVRASTGEILAAANGPGITSYNRAFVGRYPPGSTFKVVSVAALLAGGLGVDDRVSCPAEANVGGKRFRNANNGRFPDGPLLDAFAHSCNTTVVERASGLDDADLLAMADRFGIGERWKLGLPAFSGSVPEPRDLVDRAATMIGQGRVEMSPLGMAMVAAAADSGQARRPVLLPKVAPGGAAGEKLPSALRGQLRSLMRAVVERGSARSLDLPGQEVHAKTGTAEYGTQNPPRTHAWMIGFWGDVAFAVVIEDGGGGGRDAGPVALQFLRDARFVR
jgi:cell division protein FtsI/penicillin-binding protein 2